MLHQFNKKFHSSFAFATSFCHKMKQSFVMVQHQRFLTWDVYLLVCAKNFIFSSFYSKNFAFMIGTYCTRQFEECARNKCRLQSPNYPGMYPRNVSCYWTIRQRTIPTSKHAMISVSQENSHKSLVKRSIASLNKTSRTIRAWSGNQNIILCRVWSAARKVELRYDTKHHKRD